MGVHRAYKEWRSARDLLLVDDVDNFSEEFENRHRAVSRALRALACFIPTSPAEAAMLLEAALDGIDLPDTPRLIVFDALAWLKAQ